MAGIIKQLPDSIANQIAAGEVIQRPASAVKELLENAVDAGSTAIHLIIQNGGKTLIQVVDNGCGMSETDARMCFERHATSKIRTLEDIFRIRTMGFRGEALASIAAVARVELKTRLHDEDLGTRVLIEASKVIRQEPCQTPAGTSISVKNLFYNVPARRAFLKSDTAETRHIIEEFQRIALANPAIRFTLTSNDREIFHLREGNLRKRIVEMFGNHTNEKIVPVSEETSYLTIHGFIGKPGTAKKTRGEQYFFVNGRYIKSPYLHHAVMAAYEELIPENSFPLYVLFLEIDPSSIDVNVHPAKQEIKFEDEKTVYALLRTVIRHSLAKFSLTPALDFNQEDHLNRMGSFSVNPPAEKPLSTGSGIVHQGKGRPSDTKISVKGWESLYEIAKTDIQREKEVPSTNHAINDKPQPVQIHQRYILCQIKSGFILIDQQAAHERILYERFIDVLDGHEGITQQQLFPVTLHLNEGDKNILEEILPDLHKLGFNIRAFGKNTYVVEGIPAGVQIPDEQQMIESIIESYKQNLAVLKMDRKESLARSMAQNAAVKPGKKLSNLELQNLIDRLFACKNPYLSPAGKKTFLTYEINALEREFSKVE